MSVANPTSITETLRLKKIKCLFKKFFKFLFSLNNSFSGRKKRRGKRIDGKLIWNRWESGKYEMMMEKIRNERNAITYCRCDGEKSGNDAKIAIKMLVMDGSERVVNADG